MGPQRFESLPCLIHCQHAVTAQQYRDYRRDRERHAKSAQSADEPRIVARSHIETAFPEQEQRRVLSVCLRARGLPHPDVSLLDVAVRAG